VLCKINNPRASVWDEEEKNMIKRLEEALAEIPTGKALYIGAFMMLCRVVSYFPTCIVIEAANNFFFVKLPDYPIKIKFVYPMVENLWRCDVINPENAYEQSIKSKIIDLKDVRRVINLVINKFYGNKVVLSDQK